MILIRQKDRPSMPFSNPPRAAHRSGLSEVTRKRGFASPRVHSALAITRRRRDQLSLVDQRKSRNTRAGLPVASTMVRASWRAAATRVSSRVLRARPKTKSTRFCSHQNAVLLAPEHQCLAGKARVGPQHDLHPWPARPDLTDDALDLLHRPGAGVDVGAAQLGGQEMPATEDVKGQVAAAIIVAVEKAALLMPMDRVVGRVQVQDDVARGLGPESVEEKGDEHGLDRGSLVPD